MLIPSVQTKQYDKKGDSMTVEDFRNILIIDRKITISIQTKIDGIMTELYNDQLFFNNNNFRDIADKEIKFIRLEKKHIYIII